ncbi:hypothetical protein R3P38DRAFT_3165957 [Favolaschia claudopus]|uniref:Uncharacterized protein n=1 Tax=Favolaschia claudopus TaxID=2862362 RepID=A0AAW0EJL9_9AGAR
MTKPTHLSLHYHLPPTLPVKNSLREVIIPSFHLPFSSHLLSDPGKLSSTLTPRRRCVDTTYRLPASGTAGIGRRQANHALDA